MYKNSVYDDTFNDDEYIIDEYIRTRKPIAIHTDILENIKDIAEKALYDNVFILDTVDDVISSKIYKNSVYGYMPKDISDEEKYFKIYLRLRESLDLIHVHDAIKDCTERKMSLDKIEKIIAAMKLAISTHEVQINNVKENKK